MNRVVYSFALIVIYVYSLPSRCLLTQRMILIFMLVNCCRLFVLSCRSISPVLFSSNNSTILARNDVLCTLTNHCNGYALLICVNVRINDFFVYVVFFCFSSRCLWKSQQFASVTYTTPITYHVLTTPYEGIFLSGNNNPSSTKNSPKINCVCV